MLAGELVKGQDGVGPGVLGDEVSRDMLGRLARHWDGVVAGEGLTEEYSLMDEGWGFRVLAEGEFRGLELVWVEGWIDDVTGGDLDLAGPVVFDLEVVGVLAVDVEGEGYVRPGTGDQGHVGLVSVPGGLFGALENVFPETGLILPFFGLGEQCDGPVVGEGGVGEGQEGCDLVDVGWVVLPL